jgi:putative ABC transport system permease protein
MVVAVGGIGLSGALGIGVLQRQRELGVLRAIGASGRTLLQLVMLEGLWHALMAWILTVPLAWWLAEPLSAELGRIMLSLQLDYCFASQAAGAWLLILMVLALIASYWPARHAMRLSVKEALH